MRTTRIIQHNHPRSGTGTMQDIDKSREQLINELVKMRQRVAKLEVADTERKQTGEKLRLFLHSVESSVDGVAMSDLSGKITYVNNAFGRMFGYSKEELIGKDIAFIWSEEQIPKLQEAIKATMEEGWTGELIGKRKDGELFPVAISSSRVVGDKGNVIAVMASHRDITERKQMERRIEHLNLVLRAIRNVNQLIAKEKNRDRLLKGTCDNLVESCGYYDAWVAILDESGSLVTTAEAGLGRGFSLMVERLKRGELTNCARRTLRQSDIVLIENLPSTCGDCPLVENSRGRGAMAVRLEHSGKVYGILSVTMPVEFIADKEEQALFKEVAGDIAFALHNVDLEEKHKQMEEALRESETKFRIVVENIRDVIFQLSPLGIIQYVSPKVEDIYGYKPEDLIGKHLKKTTPISELPKALGAAKSVLSGKVINSFQINQVDSKGRIVPMEITAVPVRRDDKIIAVQGVMRDITERKQAEEALGKLNQHLWAKVNELETFSYAVAHDLRSPLASIQGFVDLLQDDIQNQDTERIGEDIRLIGLGVRKMGQLLEETLTYSHSGRLVKPAENIPFGEIVEEALGQFAERVRSIGATISLAETFPSVYVDRMMIKRVLTNLIQDSIAYRDKTRLLTIEIGYRLSEGETVFFVRDNGIGIDASETEKVFALFYRGTADSEGSGAGLAIAKRIIEAHEGRIWIEGQSGEGTTMCFTLPRQSSRNKGG